MKIIYCGHGEITTAWVAGLIHLRRLPRDRIPSAFEIEKATADKIPRQCGIPVFLGQDCDNNQVYFIDLSKQGQLAYLTIAGIIGDSGEEWSFRDLTPLGNRRIRLGIILERMRMVKTGRYFIIKGLQQGYTRLVQFVCEPDGPATECNELIASKQ